MKLCAGVVPLGIFLGQWIPPESSPKLPLPIAIIQGDLPIEVIRSTHGLTDGIIRRRYLEPLQRLPLPTGTLVVLPEEGVISGWADLTHPAENPYIQALAGISAKRRISIIAGLTVYHSKKQVWYNSLAFFSGKEAPVQFYHKQILVPFGEQTPPLFLCSDARWFEHLLQWFHIDYENVFQNGPDGHLFKETINDDHEVLIGPLICFEAIYPSLYRKYQRKGADIMISSSNLGWFHGHPLLEKQLLAILQLRAAEFHRPVILSANTGPSAILSAEGDILAEILPKHKSNVIFYNK